MVTTKKTAANKKAPAVKAPVKKRKAPAKKKAPAEKKLIKDMTIEERVEQLKREAEAKGLLDNLLYTELLDDFVYQTNLMRRLRAEIDSGDLVTEKTYVKNSPNLSPNKLIATYNATSNARVNTVSAIAKVIKSFGDDKEEDDDPLSAIINGGL
jgi:hypothetical protein